MKHVSSGGKFKLEWNEGKYYLFYLTEADALEFATSYGLTNYKISQIPQTPPTHSTSLSSNTIPSLANASSSGALVKG